MTTLAKTFKLVNNNLLKYATYKLNQVRPSSYQSSLKTDNVEVTAKYEISRDPNEWKFVERVLPPSLVPPPAVKSEYNTDWRPQSDDLKDKPYFVQRTKNHMLPVYLKILQRGTRRLTYVRKIQGDISLLGRELEEFLQPLSYRPIRMQVNEFAGYICINGDYVNAIKHYLMQRNY